MKRPIERRLVMKAKALFVLFFIMIFVAAVFAGEDKEKGASQLEIFSGSKEKVPFPHHAHQEKLNNCDACHSLFPKAPGAIKDLREKGRLKKKQVMNTVCVKCHKAEKAAGKKAGPTSCSVCHSI